MVTTNFQTYGIKGFQLRFRMYQRGEVRYIAVNHLLHGNLLKRHWNAKKQAFIPSAPFSEENNSVLAKFKSKYDEALLDWEGSLFEFALVSRSQTCSESIVKEGEYLSWVMDWVVENSKTAKHSDGTMCGTFETYEKVVRRLKEYCSYRNLRYERIKMSDVNTTLINDILQWIVKTKDGKGQYFSCMFKAALNKADKEGWFDMESVKKCRWIKRIRSDKRKYETLTNEQCDMLMKMRPDELPKGRNSLLYRDFCIFTLFTCQSPCDAITLQYSDIKKINGVDHFIFKRRKIENKQTTDCSVPINPVMREIMDRWKPKSRDGYIFPIRSKERLARLKTNNFDIKSFVKKCNVWLKKLGDILGCDFPLHNYTFRHTAITHYIGRGIPIIYVANLAGTSVENCEKIYYNNRGDVKSRDMVLNATTFK